MSIVNEAASSVLSGAKVYIIGAIIILSLGAIGWGLYEVYQAGATGEQIKTLAQTVESLNIQTKNLADQQASYNDHIKSLNESIAKQKVITNTINTKTEVEVSKPVYTTTQVPVSGFQLLRENAQTLNALRTTPDPEAQQ